jgi:hypothetical protein
LLLRAIPVGDTPQHSAAACVYQASSMYREVVMNASTGSLPEMINSSIVVLTKPSIATFEQYERRGTMRDALIYVGVAALLAGVLAFVFGLLGGVGAATAGLIGTVLSALISFFVFAFALFFIGKQQGGTGTQDEVFYTTALYTAPLLAINGIISAVVSVVPLLGCITWLVSLVLWLYQAYLGYLAARASMNLQQTPAIISVVVAILAQIVVGTIIVSAVVGALILRSA